MPVLFGGHNLPPMVEIGLTDLPKSGVPWHRLHPQGLLACTGLVSRLPNVSKKAQYSIGPDDGHQHGRDQLRGQVHLHELRVQLLGQLHVQWVVMVVECSPIFY